MQGFAPKQRHLARAEQFAKRDFQRDLVQAKRLEQEQVQIEQGVAKFERLEERLRELSRRQDMSLKSKAQATPAGRHRVAQLQKWHTIMAAVGFLQMCQLLHDRYKSIKEDYTKYLRDNELQNLMDPRSDQRGLAALMGEHLLVMGFLDVARNNAKAEWKLRPKQRTEWTLLMGRASSKEVAKRSETSRSYQVVIPTREEMLAVGRNACILQAMMVARIRRKKRSAAIVGIAHCLERWKRGAPMFVRMMAWSRNVKRLQRFWRRTRKRLAAVRAQIETEWIRIERDIISAEVLPALPVVAAKDSSKDAKDPSKDGKDPSKDAKDPSHVKEAKDPSHASHAKDQSHHGNSHGSSSKASKRESHTEEAKSVKIKKHMLSDERRRMLLRQELRSRRKQYLPVYTEWLSEMDAYRHHYLEWRQDREVCRAKGIKHVMAKPHKPLQPSHIPSGEELHDIVRAALGLTRQIVGKQSSSTRMSMSSSFTRLEAGDADSSVQLCREVSDIFAPSSSSPAPAASVSDLRPSVPPPI
jgi:hypothetical protein